MAFQPVTNGGQVVVHGLQANGKHTANVFGLRFTGTLDQAAADGVADEIATIYNTILGGTSDTMTYTHVTVTDLRTEGAPEFDSDSSFPLVGGDTPGVLPYQVAGLISWRTATRGRSFRGRTYLAGFTESDSALGNVDPSLITELNDFGQAVLDSALEFGIISRYHNNVKRANAIITNINGFSVGSIWATQRRRALPA